MFLLMLDSITSQYVDLGILDKYVITRRSRVDCIPWQTLEGRHCEVHLVSYPPSSASLLGASRFVRKHCEGDNSPSEDNYVLKND